MRTPTGLLTLLALTALALVASGCGGASTSSSASRPASGSKVALIVMENRNASEVVGSPDAPTFNALATRSGLATSSFAIRHPSLPNYLALTSGSTHGIAENCSDCHVAGPNLADQLSRAGVSWKAYMEDLPSPCFDGATAGGESGYAKKHNPFAYYDTIATSPERCRRVVSFDALGRDLRGDGLPTFSLIVPNLCNDSHDCPVRTADRLLARVVPQVLRQLGPKGFLIITWDEANASTRCCGVASGGRIATLVAGPGVRKGARDAAPVDHYGTLRTIEDALRLQRLGGARDAKNGSLDGLFAQAPVLR